MSQPVKTMSFEVGQRHKVLDQRRIVVGALAQADGAHLRERADGLGQSAADGFNAGDHGGGHGAQADDHYAQLARGGRNLRLQRSSGRLAASVAIVSPNLPLLFPMIRIDSELHFPETKQCTPRESTVSLRRATHAAFGSASAC